MARPVRRNLVDDYLERRRAVQLLQTRVHVSDKVGEIASQTCLAVVQALEN